MWHVSSRSVVATLHTAIHLLLTYLLPVLAGTLSQELEILLEERFSAGTFELGKDDNVLLKVLQALFPYFIMIAKIHIQNVYLNV